MYLEKLEIQGFKSFAHKNKLIFPGIVANQKRGLTTIVGPNGSGKSNIADAVRWVLGEQSLKTLRGKKSEDVIFSGSDKKSQLGLAEVSLFLNNKNKIDQNLKLTPALEKTSDSTTENNELDQILATCEEIVITRRIYRSGESEYLLNNSRVRLTDIQMLLAKANFGQKTYSVIGQGMVENFLNSSANERKDFFDEATGIKQFQIKRDTALNKLESSYENLQQVDMLLLEISPRLRSLTRQVEKLKKRSELEKNLKSTQFNYYGFLWQDINGQLDILNKQYLDLEKVKIDKDRRLEKLNDNLNKIKTTDNWREINELQPRLRELESQKGQYQKKLSKLQAELETQLESQGKFDISWLNNKIGELEKELENLILEIDSLEKSRPKIEADALSSQLQEINQELSAAEKIKDSLAKLEQENFNLNRQISKLEAVLEAQIEAQGQFDIPWLNNKQQEINNELLKIEQEITSLQTKNNNTESEKLKADISSIQQKMNGLNSELALLMEKIKLNAKSGNKNEEINHLIEQFISKLDTLDKTTDIEEMKKIIKEAKKDFQAQIKIILTGESDEDTQKIQNIQKNIIDLAEKKQALNDSLSKELIRLSGIQEKLRNLEEKKNQLNVELLNLKNNLEKAQSSSDTNKIENEKIAINRQINDLNHQIKELQASYKYNELQAKKITITENIQACRFKDSTIIERSKLLIQKQNKTEQEIFALKEKIAKSQSKVDESVIDQEKNSLNQALENINKEIKELTNNLELLNQAKEKEKSEIFACQNNIQLLQQEINDTNAKLNSIKISSTRQETKLEDLENNIRNDGLEISLISKHQVDMNGEDLDRWQKIITSHKNQLEQIGGIDQEIEKEHHETKTRFDFLTKQTEDLNKAIKSLEQIIHELDINIKSRFDLEFKVISEKFNEYFQILFNGGTAKMSKILIEDLEKEELKNGKLTTAYGEGLSAAEIESQQAAEEKVKKIKFLKKYNAIGLAGIDMQATPPGKKIQSVAMLSGGERALTAIALICAIISANPSPFVFLDEVDAALDESNSERLAKILDDLSNKTQFIVITHNRASMRRANILYGVTMQTDGVSQIISVKLDEAEEYKK